MFPYFSGDVWRRNSAAASGGGSGSGERQFRRDFESRSSMMSPTMIKLFSPMSLVDRLHVSLADKRVGCQRCRMQG